MAYSYDRRMAATKPKRKFNMGDAVDVMNGDEVLFSGKVSYIFDWDDYQETYKYKIAPDGGGSRNTYNEKSLRKKRR